MLLIPKGSGSRDVLTNDKASRIRQSPWPDLVFLIEGQLLPKK